MREDGDGDDVGKRDRKQRVLNILTESGYALPPVVIWRNAKLQGATFERRSVNNYLTELAEDGYVTKVSATKIDNGELVEIPLSEEGYFIATDKADEF